MECHAGLDKESTFHDPDAALSSHAKHIYRAVTFGTLPTAGERGDKGSKGSTFRAGDKVRVFAAGSSLRRRNLVLGVIEHFVVEPAAASSSSSSSGVMAPPVRWQGGGKVVLARHPPEVFGANALKEVDVGRLDPGSCRLKPGEWAEELQKKVLELPARLKVRHEPKRSGKAAAARVRNPLSSIFKGARGALSSHGGNGGGGGRRGHSAHDALPAGYALADKGTTTLVAGRQQVSLVVAVVSGLGKVVTKGPPDGSGRPCTWHVSQAVFGPDGARRFSHVSGTTFGTEQPAGGSGDKSDASAAVRSPHAAKFMSSDCSCVHQTLRAQLDGRRASSC